MNYRKIYMQIILHAKSEMELGLRPKNQYQKKKFPNQYFEFHHILPKSLFPNWEKRKSNIVALTGREHFFIHQLLLKIYDYPEMIYAAWRLAGDGKRKVTSKEYEFLKIKMKEEASKREHAKFLKHFGMSYEVDSNPQIEKYQKWNAKPKHEIKFPKISEVRKGKKGTPHTEEHKRYMKELMTGRKCPWSKDSKLVLGIKIYCKELDKVFLSRAEVREFLGVSKNNMQINTIMKKAKRDWFEYKGYHFKVWEAPKKNCPKWLLD